MLEAVVSSVHEIDDAERSAEAKAVFHLRMRARGIRDLEILRAFELVPRHLFVPHRYRDLVCRDLPLPIGCGQTLEAPWMVARMLEALHVGRGHRVLEVGSGSGYTTAVLSQLGAEIVGVERYQTLATAAKACIAEIGAPTACVLWADGMHLSDKIGEFDRILVNGSLPRRPENLLALLRDDGLLVCAMEATTGQVLMRIGKGLTSASETGFGACRLTPIQPGLASAL